MASDQLMVKMVFDRWNSLLTTCNENLNSISDEKLFKEIVPGKNRGIYILGHLIAVHEAMLSILGLGGPEHPELVEIFIKSPDRSVDVIPSPKELRDLWRSQIESITPKLESISTDEWFEKHSAVSAEDFEREPHRNKLNVLLTRVSHLSYHTGQLRLLKYS